MSNQQGHDDLFIHTPTTHPAHNVALSERYTAVLAALITTKELYAAYKKARGQRVPGELHGKQHNLYLQRERACAVAYHRVKIADAALRPLLQPLIDIVNELHESYAKQGLLSYCQEIEQNNLIAAEELFEESCVLHFELKLIYCGDVGSFGIHELYKNRPSLERRFAGKYCGQGSAYMFDGTDRFAPPPGPHMTKAEAQESVSQWSGIADNLGGGGIVVDLTEYAKHLADMEVLRQTEPDTAQAALIATCTARALVDIKMIYRKEITDNDRQFRFKGSVHLYCNDRLVILHVAKGLQAQGIAVVDFTVHGEHENMLYVPHKEENAAVE